MENKIQSERNAGIDLLRVILSFSIISLHILYYGGFRTHISPGTIEFYILWLLGVILSSAVNCFAIISGYVFYDTKIKSTNILRLFLIVVYHGFVITVLFRVFFSETVDCKNWIQAFLPISQEEFWYFSSYFGVFFFIPIIIQGMRAMTKKEASRLVIALVLVFSVIPLFSDGDPFDLSEGYSVLWLLVLFILGTYLKKYSKEIKIKRIVLVGIFAACTLITCLVMAVSVVIPSLDGMALMQYTSPTLVICAIAVVMFFISMSVPAFLRKACTYCAPFAFSIYLLHEHPLVREHLIYDRFVFVQSWPSVLQILSVFVITVGIWAVCFGLEFIRRLVFRLLRVEKFLKKIEKKNMCSTGETSMPDC